MTACPQPSCSGTIEDGYCDRCGMAPTIAPPAVAHAAQPGHSARTTPGSSRTGSGRVPSTRSSRSTRSTRSGSQRTGRTGPRVLGSRPLARPALAPIDPLATLVSGIVPDHRRLCSKDGCGSKLKRDDGFCPTCGQEYSFTPTLVPGAIVADKYEIKGTIAFGGLGWIYLALDTVLNRWVTMKGLLNSRDPSLLEVAVQEREYLAAVKHPNIVAIYDFLTHGREGYIVMEYVNGKTLMNLRKEAGGPLPVAEACSYIAEILPSFGYLDEMGLVYCDFKPDNVMVEEETVKLIDLGAVRRADDPDASVYSTKGYAPPDSEQLSPMFDLYTVGRALAVLVADFDYRGKYIDSLPPASEVPVFEQHKGLHRFLLKATRAKPEERFQSAAEMAEQLVGVLRTIVGPSVDLGPAESSLFEADSAGSLEASPASAQGSDGVPRLKVDREDAGASIIAAAAAVGDPRRRRDMFLNALKSHPASLELRLRIVDELISLGEFGEVDRRLAQISADAPADWRTAWYRGRRLLADGRSQASLEAFLRIVDDLPGELGPQQAVARAHEVAKNLDQAIHYYDSVSRTDPGFVASAFGLARCFEQKRDRAAAAEALRRVPPSSNRYALAQTTLARLLISDSLGSPRVDDLVLASDTVEGLAELMSGLEAHLLRADVLVAAARHADAPAGKPHTKILGVVFAQRALRLAAEQELRACARVAESDEDRVLLVDAANAVRPYTLV
jgi:serine/threonine-protein kinase PknG